MVINKKKERKADHLNFMGGESYNIKNPIRNLEICAASCFFGEPMYYQEKNEKRKPQIIKHGSTQVRLADTLGFMMPPTNGTTPAEIMENAIDRALEYNVESTLQVAVNLRNNENIRTTPQVILVRAANKFGKGTGSIRQYAPDIVKRADEPSICIAYQLDTFGKPIPNSLKKGLKDALEKFDNYQLSKYRMENRGVKTVDVVNLVHAYSPSIDALVKGTLRTTGKTWESILSERGASKDTWEYILTNVFYNNGRVNNYMALIRNIRNILGAKVSPKHVNLMCEMIKDKDAVKYSKQLPFRFYTAYNMNQSAPPQVLDALEDALMYSVDNLPTINGKVISLCDNSGSAWGTMTSSAGTMQIARIGNLTGILTGMNSDEGYVGLFGDRLKVIPIRKRTSVFDNMQKCDALGTPDKIGYSTENGIWIFWRDAINQRQHWDNVFIYSDMQAGHGGLYGIDSNEYRPYSWNADDIYIDVAKLIQTYRSQVNPNVNVFLVQIAGYQDTIVPEYYNRTYILGGWSDAIIRFAATMNAQYAQ